MATFNDHSDVPVATGPLVALFVLTVVFLALFPRVAA